MKRFSIFPCIFIIFISMFIISCGESDKIPSPQNNAPKSIDPKNNESEKDVIKHLKSMTKFNCGIILSDDYVITANEKMDGIVDGRQENYSKETKTTNGFSRKASNGYSGNEYAEIKWQGPEFNIHVLDEKGEGPDYEKEEWKIRGFISSDGKLIDSVKWVHLIVRNTEVVDRWGMGTYEKTELEVRYETKLENIDLEGSYSSNIAYLTDDLIKVKNSVKAVSYTSKYTEFEKNEDESQPFNDHTFTKNMVGSDFSNIVDAKIYVIFKK